ncbi:MAG TPA: CDP-alcohol phosphatidyltransferase family protein [Kofleriaceae bacterium]|nr:CDP-alcohol phosphatidyltransferase family protein [Kofleriaceae bacterium]
MSSPSEATRAPGRPLVTANQVTVTRLIPMPLIAWLIYQGPTAWWMAIGIAFVVGSTDYLDGHLARKYGPTELGALLDPLADKVFLAFMYVPLADRGLVPSIAVGLMFVREFLVTAMRSAYAQRHIQFETSYLAKVKTWVQMQGAGTLMVCALLDRTGAYVVLFGTLAVPLAVLIVVLVGRRRLYRNLLVGTALMLIPLGLYAAADALGDMRLFFHGATWILTALTWVSALDYLVGGLPRLRRAGGFGRADAVRVVGAVILPIVLIAALVSGAAPPWAVLGLFAIELAVGGLDNLLSVHGRSGPALPWGGRVLGASLLVAAAFPYPAAAVALCSAALVVSAVGAAIEFWRGRDLYL